MTERHVWGFYLKWKLHDEYTCRRCCLLLPAAAFQRPNQLRYRRCAQLVNLGIFHFAFTSIFQKL
jgi:hypothetical protein